MQVGRVDDNRCLVYGVKRGHKVRRYPEASPNTGADPAKTQPAFRARSLHPLRPDAISYQMRRLPESDGGIYNVVLPARAGRR
jgi:hypothetical protein